MMSSLIWHISGGAHMKVDHVSNADMSTARIRYGADGIHILKRGITQKHLVECQWVDIPAQVMTEIRCCIAMGDGAGVYERISGKPTRIGYYMWVDDDHLDKPF